MYESLPNCDIWIDKKKFEDIPIKQDQKSFCTHQQLLMFPLTFKINSYPATITWQDE